ncbi:MAG: PadR family transcriptional regulator [Thermoanaerobaculia bacterium]
MSLPHVLLGLLSRGAASGWDLKSRMTRDPSLAWDAELSQIYPVLKRLLRGGFVALKRRGSSKGPARREYRVTPAGRREFLDWLAEPLHPSTPRDAHLSRLAFLERLTPERRTSQLKNFRALLVERLKKANPGATAARRRRRALLETELRWVDAELLLLSKEEAEAAAEADAQRQLGL